VPPGAAGRGASGDGGTRGASEGGSVDGGQEISASSKGLEFINLQGGADFPVSPGLRIGPFLSASVGQFSSTSVSGGGLEFSGDITDKGIHEWVTIGIRGAFNL
jgi:hypothetical protein